MRALKIAGKILLGTIAVVLVLVVVIAGTVALGLNTQMGHDLIAAAAKRYGGVEITGLAGRFPDNFRADRITVADALGVWLEMDGLTLDWTPTALIHKEIRATSLTAERVHVTRYPASSDTSPSSASSSSSSGFDYRVAVDHLKVPKVELPEATLSLDGRVTYQPGQVPAVVDVQLTVTTPDAMGQGPASLSGILAGPLNHASLKIVVDGKGLTTNAKGTLDLENLAADLTLGIDHPAFQSVSADRFDATVKGDANAAVMHSVLSGLRLPGAQPALLGDGPLTLDATYKNGASPDITATLTAGTTATDGLKIAADAQLTLATMAAKLNLRADHLAVSGAGAQIIEAHAEGDATKLDLHSVITGLVAPGATPAMLGTAPLVLDAHYRQDGAPEIALQLTGDTVALTASGKLPTESLALDYHLVLPKLAAFAPAVTGQADLVGQIDGTLDNFAVKATAHAGVTTAGVASTIDGTIDANGLPDKPAGAVSVKGAYGGQPVTLDATAAVGDDKLTHIVLSDATWQAIRAKGAFTLAPDGGLPTGSLAIEARRLPAPTRSGAAHATIDLSRDGAVPLLKVLTEVNAVSIEGASVSRGVFTGQLRDPIGPKPELTASLVVDGAKSGAYSQNLRLDVTGPQDALAIKLGVTGTAALTAAATLDVTASRVNLTSLQGSLRGQTLRLAAPTSITYAPQVTIGATHLTLGGSALDIAGRVSPTFDLTASLRAVPAELARLIDPTFAAEGTLQAQARVQGTADKPSGTLHLTGSGLRMRNPQGIPAARIDAQAQLADGRARIDATITAGSARLQVAGTAPVAPGGDYDLTAKGGLDLALLDPFLTGAGAQTRGQLAFDATITGTQPTPSGTLTLHNGSVTIPAQGARLSDIEALVRAQPDRVVIESLTAKAGPGTLTGSGSVGLTAPMPIVFKLAARNASPLSSDLITTNLNADITLSGALQTAMAATGTIRVNRAEINIPQRLPASLPVLAIRQPGPPPPPPAPPVPINLDLTLTAPGQIFVRGHGLDAEMAGNLHIGGTADAPKPDGGFSLRRGQFSLAGQNLTFSTGKVGFDGSLPIDPSLDFTATSYGTSVAATLAVTGTATHPKIKLSSVPELPQDEVLAQLLFRRSAADLTTFQLAQIAAALAQIADVGGSGGLDPLGAVRKGLGLDVLSVGGSSGSSSPTVEAGRNLGHGLYVGAKQSTAGSGSQATVRLDITHGLRLEADLGVAPAQSSTPPPGAPPTGNQVGITYEFDY